MGRAKGHNMHAKILCVEDDPGILALQLTLLRHLGYEALGVGDGLQAYDMILKERPDALILDVMLPGCDGFTLAHKIRRNPDIRNTPIAFVTAKSDLTDFRMGFRCGGRIYLAKPFTSKALQTAIESLLLQAKVRPHPTARMSSAATR